MYNLSCCLSAPGFEPELRFLCGLSLVTPFSFYLLKHSSRLVGNSKMPLGVKEHAMCLLCCDGVSFMMNLKVKVHRLYLKELKVLLHF